MLAIPPVKQGASHDQRADRDRGSLLQGRRRCLQERAIARDSAPAAFEPHPCAAMLRRNISSDATKKAAAMAAIASRLGHTTSRPAPR